MSWAASFIRNNWPILAVWACAWAADQWPKAALAFVALAVVLIAIALYRTEKADPDSPFFQKGVDKSHDPGQA